MSGHISTSKRQPTAKSRPKRSVFHPPGLRLSKSFYCLGHCAGEPGIPGVVKQKSVLSGKNAAVTKARHRAHPWGSLGTGGTGRVHSTSGSSPTEPANADSPSNPGLATSGQAIQPSTGKQPKRRARPRARPIQPRISRPTRTAYPTQHQEPLGITRKQPRRAGQNGQPTPLSARKERRRELQ